MHTKPTSTPPAIFFSFLPPSSHFEPNEHKTPACPAPMAKTCPRRASTPAACTHDLLPLLRTSHRTCEPHSLAVARLLSAVVPSTYEAHLPLLSSLSSNSTIHLPQPAPTNEPANTSFLLLSSSPHKTNTSSKSPFPRLLSHTRSSPHFRSSPPPPPNPNNAAFSTSSHHHAPRPNSRATASPTLRLSFSFPDRPPPQPNSARHHLVQQLTTFSSLSSEPHRATSVRPPACDAAHTPPPTALAPPQLPSFTSPWPSSPQTPPPPLAHLQPPRAATNFAFAFVSSSHTSRPLPDRRP